MKIEIITNEEFSETRIKIYTKEKNQEIEQIVKKIQSLKKDESNIINGYQDRVLFRLKLGNINRFYTQLGITYADVEQDTYKIKNKLYELEELLQNTSFIRISKSEIVNVDQIQKIDLSFSGTICVYFKDGSSTYASRRFVKKVKEFILKEKGCGENEKNSR